MSDNGIAETRSVGEIIYLIVVTVNVFPYLTENRSNPTRVQLNSVQMV